MTKRKFPSTQSPLTDDDNITYHIAADLSQHTGQTLVIGETVFLSDEGVEVLSSQSGQFENVNAYNFIDSDRNVIGGAYARNDAGQNIVGFRVVDEAGQGDDTILHLISEAASAATATIDIAVQIDGQSSDTYIGLKKRGATTSEIDLITNPNGRVRIGRKLNLLGASLELCDIYIKDTNLIIKYNDAGTVRYKYLNLSGTTTTWTHTTTEP